MGTRTTNRTFSFVANSFRPRRRSQGLKRQEVKSRSDLIVGNVYAGWDLPSNGPEQSDCEIIKKTEASRRVWLLASARFAKWLVQIRRITFAANGLSIGRAALIALFAAFAPGLASGVSLLGILLFVIHGVSPWKSFAALRLQYRT
jgi:hypothetical protein